MNHFQRFIYIRCSAFEMKLLLTILFSTLTLFTSYGQTNQLTGRILSSVTNDAPSEPVIIMDPRNKVYVESDSLGFYTLDSLTKGKTYNFQFLAFGYEEVKRSMEISKQLDTLNLTLFTDCSFDSLTAHEDWQKEKPRLLLIGSIAPLANSEHDLKFEDEYNVEYYDFGCTPPALDCILTYNQEIFKLLDQKFGNQWKAEIREDVIGLKK